MRHGAGMHSRGDEAGDVRHVHKENRVDGFGDFAHALEIDDARIRAGSRHDHARLVLVGQLFDFFVIDALVFLAHAVGDEFVHAAGKIQRVPVRKVAAMRQVHAQHRVAGLQRGHVHRYICGGSGMRLHVGVFRAEQFLGAIDGQLLDLVGVLAAAVVALARIALRVFVGENRAHGLEHRLGDQVLRGNQFQSSSLPLGFVAKQLRDLRIDPIERAVHAVVSVGTLRHGLVPRVSGLHLTPGPRRCRGVASARPGRRPHLAVELDLRSGRRLWRAIFLVHALQFTFRRRAPEENVSPPFPLPLLPPHPLT